MQNHQPIPMTPEQARILREEFLRAQLLQQSWQQQLAIANASRGSAQQPSDFLSEEDIQSEDW